MQKTEQPAHGMAVETTREARVALPGHGHDLRDVGQVVVKIVDISTHAAGATKALVIRRVDHIARMDKRRDQMTIAPAMFAKPM